MGERNRRAYLLGSIGAVVLLTLLFVAVLVFRGGTYWLPIVLGGVAVSAFGVRTAR